MATVAPVVTTSPPIVTTSPPIVTPAATTAAPVTTPPVTTPAVTPAPTTLAPVTTPPVATTNAPTVTTEPPVTTEAPPNISPTPTKSPSGTLAPPSPATPSPNVPSTPSPTNGGGGSFTPPSPVFAPPVRTPSPPAVSAPPSSSGSGNDSGSGLSKGVIIGIVAGGGALLLVVLFCLAWCICRPTKKRRPYESPTRRQSQAALLKASGQENRQQGYQPSRTPPRDNFAPPKPPPKQPVPAMREQRAPPQSEWGNQNPQRNWQTPPPVVAPSLKQPQESRSQPDSPSMETPLQAPPRPPSAFSDSHRLFTWEELKQATDNFSPANLLGEGGFGKVFKGVTSKGVTIAVKQLTLGGLGGQGEREFRSEVEVISRVHHRHLVTLLGYCMKGEERLLVLEYMANGTLESNLHGKNRPVMDWASRKKVAIGAARGLAYLHEDCHPRIIHRDIKASNILMDEHFDAQVADFGLAKLAEEKDTHVTTRVMGTFGYLAPEYAMSGKLTDKSDVFSFGVVLLELISGRRPVDMTQPPGQESLVEWARPILMQERYSDLVDPRLKAAGYDPDEMNCFIKAAMLSIRSTATKRPKMTQIVRMLEDDGLSPDSTSNYRPTQRFDSVPFGGGPYISSEFGSEQASSGEYSQSSQGYPSGPSAVGPAQSRLGGSYRSEASGPPSAEVTLDVIDEHRDARTEQEQYGDVPLYEDEETGRQPAQVQLAQWRPTTPGSALPPPPGRHSRQGSLTPPSPANLRPPPGRSPSNASSYGQPPQSRRSSRGSSGDFNQSQANPSTSGSEYGGNTTYMGNTILMPERFDGEGR